MPEPITFTDEKEKTTLISPAPDSDTTNGAAEANGANETNGHTDANGVNETNGHCQRLENGATEHAAQTAPEKNEIERLLSSWEAIPEYLQREQPEIYLRLSHGADHYYRLISSLRRLDYAQDVMFYFSFIFILSACMLITLIQCAESSQAHQLINMMRDMGLFPQNMQETEIFRYLRGTLAALAPIGMMLPTMMVLMRNSYAAGSNIKTHLSLSDDGMRMVRMTLNGKQWPLKRWRDLRAIRYIEPRKKGQTPKLHFVFTRGFPIKIGLHNFTEEHEVKALFDVCKAKLNDPHLLTQLKEVEAKLAPANEKTYTELWSKSLLNSPERLRLTALPPDSRLQDARYRVVKQLGAGGQGTAYLTEDELESRLIVLKEYILPDSNNVQDQKRALTRLEDEAHLLARLDHAQIVKALDLFVEDHRAYLVLEHIDGPPLKALVAERGALPQTEVLGLALQMCSVLEYLHGLAPPMVHQDFTPDNLLLTERGVLKLVDFNVAKERQNTKTALVVGKHAYMPPEQFKGKVCPQSDIYALGASLHFLLTGADPEPLSCCHPGQSNGTVSERIDGIVARATALELSDRYASVVELHHDLKELADTMPAQTTGAQ